LSAHVLDYALCENRRVYVVVISAGAKVVALCSVETDDGRVSGFRGSVVIS